MLFDPYSARSLQLANRMVMVPLTRSRATPQHTPNELMATYCGQRAVALANDSPFGLGGSVFTRDIERGKQVARRLDTGMVFINSAAVSSSELPFGSVKRSGYGRELSAAGIQEFVNKTLIRSGRAAAPA